MCLVSVSIWTKFWAGVHLTFQGTTTAWKTVTFKNCHCNSSWDPMPSGITKYSFYCTVLGLFLSSAAKDSCFVLWEQTKGFYLYYPTRHNSQRILLSSPCLQTEFLRPGWAAIFALFFWCNIAALSLDSNSSGVLMPGQDMDWNFNISVLEPQKWLYFLSPSLEDSHLL